MLGDNFSTVGWPDCGEIDIMEYRGQDVTTVLGTVHGPGYSGSNGIGADYNLIQDRFDTGFHTFTLEWGIDYLKWYVDGVLFLSLIPDSLPGEWVFDHPFYIILNIAVGGNFVGSPNQYTVFPQTMLIDYVRVYREIP
jgi:beta-glucanase (GH16 family)